MVKHFILPDVQAKPGVDLSHLAHIGQYIVDKKPDVIVCIGDFCDMPSLSSYDKGKQCFEGRRYKADIAAGREAMDLLLGPMKEYNKKAAMNHKERYKPRMVMTLGNHECFPGNTEVLCRSGFKQIEDVEADDFVLTLNGTWEQPTGFIRKEYAGTLKTHKSRSVDISCTPNHRLYYESNGKIHEKLAKDMPLSCDVPVSVLSGTGVDLSDAQIRFDAVAATDSHHDARGRLTFYQSGDKADTIRKIIEDAGVEYRETSRTRDTVQVCGKTLKAPPKESFEFYMRAPEWSTDNNKRLPERVLDFNAHQFEVYLDTLVFCDGTIPTGGVNSSVFYGRKEICDDVQRACVSHGYRASITEYREGQYRVNICKTTKCRVENFFNKSDDEEFNGLVYCLTVPSESFFIRRSGKVMAVGNCRIARTLQYSPEYEGMIGYHDLPYEDWEVIDYLKPIDIDGIMYVHYLANPMTGKPYSGNALNQLAKVGRSFVVGHKQTLDVATRFTIGGTQQWGIIAGACYSHQEEYKGYQGNDHFRGALMLHRVIDGSFDPTIISLDYFKEKYGESNE